MPGFLLNQGAKVTCSHTGRAQPAAPNPKVTIEGQAVVTLKSLYGITGCSLPAPPAANGPCVSAQFITASTKVTVMGDPVLLQDSQSICVPTGAPLLVKKIQSKVLGT
jgi:hypothetical protein